MIRRLSCHVCQHSQSQPECLGQDQLAGVSTGLWPRSRGESLNASYRKESSNSTVLLLLLLLLLQDPLLQLLLNAALPMRCSLPGHCRACCIA